MSYFLLQNVELQLTYQVLCILFLYCLKMAMLAETCRNE